MTVRKGNKILVTSLVRIVFCNAQYFKGLQYCPAADIYHKDAVDTPQITIWVGITLPPRPVFQP